MTITQFEYLLAVVNHGNFSAAAKSCFVTQPSLSIQVQNLEDELGVILLDRSQKPIVPTEIGCIVLEQIRTTIAEFYTTKDKVNIIKGAVSGRLRLGIIPTVSPYLMPKFIPDFIERCPEVELEICDMHTSDIISALNQDMIDVAILSGGESAIPIKETKLFDDKLYLYVSPKNDLYKRNSIFIDDINIKQLLILSEGNCLRNQTLKLCKERENLRLPYDFKASSLETLMYTVDSTSMVTIIPGMAIGFIPESKYKQIKPFIGVNAYRTITMAVGRTYVKKSLVDAVVKSVMAVHKKYSIPEL